MQRLFPLLILPLVAAALIVGCTHPKRWFSNRSLVSDTIVALPGGGEIRVEVEQTESTGHAAQHVRRYVWDQPGRERKVLSVVRVGDAPSPQLDPASYTSRVSDDGNVAELLARDGRVLATFNYSAGTATFAP